MPSQQSQPSQASSTHLPLQSFPTLKRSKVKRTIPCNILATPLHFLTSLNTAATSRTFLSRVPGATSSAVSRCGAPATSSNQQPLRLISFLCQMRSQTFRLRAPLTMTKAGPRATSLRCSTRASPSESSRPRTYRRQSKPLRSLSRLPRHRRASKTNRATSLKI